MFGWLIVLNEVNYTQSMSRDAYEKKKSHLFFFIKQNKTTNEKFEISYSF